MKKPIKKKKPPPKPAKKPVPRRRAGKKKPSAVKKKYANLRDAAGHCGCTPPTLRNYISKYPDLPVHKRGVGREGWQIDLEKLDAWRKKTGLLCENIRLPGDVGTTRKIKQSERKSKIQTDLLELELKKKMGELVDRQQVVSHLSTKLAQFGKRMDLLPAMIGRKCTLAPAVIEEIRKYLNDAREALIREDNNFWEKPAS